MQRKVAFKIQAPSQETPAALSRQAGRKGVYSGGTTGPTPKSQERRRPRLLPMARDMPCLLQVPEVCNRDPATTVACHSNWSDHGKGASRKADDCYSTWGCFACHTWLDQGDADSAVKRLVFDTALRRQLEWWTRIAADRGRCGADRRAARWAVDQVRMDASQAISEETVAMSTSSL